MKSGYSNFEVPNRIPNSWKSIARFNNQQISFYTCEKTTIPFPEHWEMNKWNCNNAPPPEVVEIRIRDPIDATRRRMDDWLCVLLFMLAVYCFLLLIRMINIRFFLNQNDATY